MGVDTKTACSELSTQSAARNRTGRHASAVIAGFTALLLTTSALNAAPAIRTSDQNRVPACASPERLTAFLVNRNPGLDPRFRDIARWYKHFGEAWRVRWDYAFYQMILETNALKYRRADGRRGDVHEKQNNFAGIGATGRGAPGDKYPDIKTGVHAQIQHLVAYSGEMLANPIAPRTQLVQDSIVEQSRRLRRAVTFGDLARRWAADRAYAKSIDGVAEQFRTAYCNGVSADAAPLKGVPQPQPAVRRNLSAFAPPSGLGGPRPLKLAGPDTLPWSNAQVAAPSVTNDIPAEGKGIAATAPSGEPQRKPSPVRTIWSRDGVMKPVAATPSPRPEERKVSTEQRAPVAAAPAPSAPADDAGDEPALPRFKIEPLAIPPSRLGGPVDAAALKPAAPDAPAAPSAHFKDIVNIPATTSQVAPCRVLSASYGGNKTLLVRAASAGETRYTALTVLDGFEKTMFDTYAKSQGISGEVVGEYATKDDALADARTNCPSG